MGAQTFTVTDPDGIEITVDRWLPAGAPRAALHVMHGWAEHAARYARFAQQAAGQGIAVYVDDHRGHGRTGMAAGGLGDLGPRGMDGVLDAAHAITAAVAAEQPDIPLYLFGHSWGSFLAQRFIRRWADELDGVILTGTTLRVPGEARREGSLNARFEPAATAYDWLSRDPVEVQRYVEDSWCGFERMQAAGAEGRRADGTDTAEVVLPDDLPIAVLNGGDDPVGGAEGGRKLADAYRAAGVQDVTLKVYDGGRHELLNETNRDEVTVDLLAWLDDHIAHPRRFVVGN